MRMPFIPPLRLLVMGLFTLAGVMVASVVLAPQDDTYEATLTLTPLELVVLKDAPVRLDVFLSARTPVNAFSGDIIFDTSHFTVKSISYNTELADLWVQKPWYSKADNIIHFAGGTTRPGGFTGNEQLITVELVAHHTGKSVVSIRDARVLKHDGLGSDASVAPSIDSVIESLERDPHTPRPQTGETQISVITLGEKRDVTGDGKVSFADAATLMLHLGSSDPTYDLNGDGTVSLPDLAIITAP